MFIGKDPKGAERMASKLAERSVQKEYVARVKGKFPDGVVVCDQPIMQVSPKLGLNRVRATGKTATTKFRRLAYYPSELETQAQTPATSTSGSDEIQRPATPPHALANESEGYSIIHCLPLTGRTHQIRVHLQFLGHPISNDPIYSNRRVFGPDLAKNESHGERDEEIMDRLNKMGKTELADTVDTSSYKTHYMASPNVAADTDPAILAQLMEREQKAAAEDYSKRKGERLSGELCEVCNTELYSDPGVHELGIFLHAVAYADRHGDWSYRSKMPSWGLPPPGLDGPREVPDWVPGQEGEETVIGHGTVPPAIGVDDDGRVPRGTKAPTGPILLEGVGLLDVSSLSEGLKDVDGEAKTVESAAAAQ